VVSVRQESETYLIMNEMVVGDRGTSRCGVVADVVVGCVVVRDGVVVVASLVESDEMHVQLLTVLGQDKRRLYLGGTSGVVDKFEGYSEKLFNILNFGSHSVDRIPGSSSRMSQFSQPVLLGQVMNFFNFFFCIFHESHVVLRLL